MSNLDGQEGLPPADEGVLEPADSLMTDALDDDPLDTGIIPPDGYAGSTRYGTTAEEAERGESLDQLLAEEEPDVVADVVDDRWGGGPGPRSGRLVSGEDDVEVWDVGPDAGAAGAEEAAIHITDGDAEGDGWDG